MTSEYGLHPAPGERERVLAAAGWESDPRRRTVLRALLLEQIDRIYLYCYAQARHRATALDRARRTLLSAARTLEVVPDGCPLTTWCFFLLEEERANPAAEPDLWHGLLDLSRRISEGASARGASERVRELAGMYLDYLSLPSDTELLLRADAEGAHRDLECFLGAQFGDEKCEARGSGPGWRQVIPAGFWRSSRLIAVAVVVVALVLAAVLWRTWQGIGERGGVAAANRSSSSGTAPGAGAWTSANGAGRSAPVSAATLPVVEEAALRHEGRALAVSWKPFPRAERYRLLILTARLDTLRIVDELQEASSRVDPRGIDGLSAPGSYLFQVDGLAEGVRVASSGLVPFELE